MVDTLFPFERADNINARHYLIARAVPTLKWGGRGVGFSEIPNDFMGEGQTLPHAGKICTSWLCNNCVFCCCGATLGATVGSPEAPIPPDMKHLIPYYGKAIQEGIDSFWYTEIIVRPDRGGIIKGARPTILRLGGANDAIRTQTAAPSAALLQDL